MPLQQQHVELKTLRRHPKCSSFYSVTACSASNPHGASSKAPAPLSPSVAYLEQLSMHMSVSKALKGGPQYAMTVYNRKTKATWRHCRDFEEYKDFQTRLVATMKRGHFCFAECPWLCVFARGAFPKPKFFNYASPRVVELRRKALNSFFNTLQAVLLNPSNHGCGILTGQVAKEFVGFVYGGDVGQSAPWEHFSPVARNGGILARTFSETCMSAAAVMAPSSSVSSMSSTSDEEGEMDDGGASTIDRLPTMSDAHHSDERECCAMCALHQVRSDEQVFAWWQSKSRFEKTLSTMSSSVASSPSATTTANSSSSSRSISPFSSASRHRRFNSDFDDRVLTKKCSDQYESTPRDMSMQLTLVSEPDESPRYSLADTAVLGGSMEENFAVLGSHDGTPKEAYPGTPKAKSFHSSSLPSSFPTGWTTSSLSSPPASALSFLQDDEDEKAADAKATATDAKAKRERAGLHYNSVPTPTFLRKRIRTLPRRSLNVLSCMSNALSRKLKSAPPTTTF